jgi:uncharacterized iron-regulated membrane protein
MTPRRFLFWIHLTAGSVAGIVILAMSVTGILLAYRRQITNWGDRGFQVQPAAGAQRLLLEQLLASLQESQGRLPSNITIRVDAAAPVALDFGRERTVFVNPYTAQVLGEGSRRLRGFFSTVEDVHRWLGFGGTGRNSGRAITGACNLLFLVLVTSGPFLWWPKEWNWNALRKVILFRSGPWIRARDWNWHNVLGFWCVAPLFFIVITGVVMSYGWANNLLYRMTGNAPPPPTAQIVPEGSRNPGQRTEQSAHRPESSRLDGLEKLFARAAQQVPDWTTITLRLPNSSGPLTFSIDRGNAGRPDLRSQLTLDPVSGEILRWESFSSYSRGRQLRAWARFTHTGEAGGLPGQTIAAIASAGASLLVFTGLSLGVRRFMACKGRRVKVLASAGP